VTYNYNWHTKVKLDINLIEVHPQLNYNWHLVDGALVGVVTCLLACQMVLGMNILLIYGIARKCYVKHIF
jgi:hypothetical protein